MKQILAIALLATFVSTPLFAQSTCKCRYQGGYVNAGQVACIKLPSGSSLARCEKVLNNSSWTFLNQPCPYASYRPDTNQTPFPAKLDLTTSRS